MDKSERDDFAATLAVKMANTISLLDVNTRKFQDAQADRLADRYEDFVWRLTSQSDAIAQKQLSATRAAAIAASGSVVVAIIVAGAQLYK